MFCEGRLKLLSGLKTLSTEEWHERGSERLGCSLWVSECHSESKIFDVFY